MNAVLLVFAAFLLANILAGLVRVVRGPNPPDRMAAAQLFGTMGVGILVALGAALGREALIDAALVFALLGALATVAFVSRVWRRLSNRRETRP